MFDPETNDAILVRNEDGTYTPHPLKATRPKEVPPVVPHSSTANEMPLWATLFLGAICVVLCIGALALIISTVAWVSETQTEFARRDQIVEHCLDSEKYTRQECITLAGEK